jgi:pyrroline-5-carboxylate reductase
MTTGLGFIGAGNMGEAMIRGVLSAKLYPAARVFVHDTAAGRSEALRHRLGVSVAPSSGTPAAATPSSSP